MSVPKDAVEDGAIQWETVTAGVFGSWMLAVIYWYIDVVELVLGAAADAVVGIFEYGAALVTAVFGVPNTILDAAWASAAGFVAELGILAMPAALLITVVTLWLLMAFFERVKLP